jgi:hypothetical protein
MWLFCKKHFSTCQPWLVATGSVPVNKNARLSVLGKLFHLSCIYEGESINTINLHSHRRMYPLCTHELGTALLHVWTRSTGNFLIKLAVLSLTVSCQNGCVDAILKFPLFIDSTSYNLPSLVTSFPYSKPFQKYLKSSDANFIVSMSFIGLAQKYQVRLQTPNVIWARQVTSEINQTSDEHNIHMHSHCSLCIVTY